MLVLIFLSGHFCAQSDEPLYRHYTTLDGLSSNEVYDVLCDSRGFMWFATNRGISVFDGASFRNFTIEDGLVDNSVLGLFEDYQGRIWCRTISGSVSFIQGESVHTIEARTTISYPNSIYVGHDDVVLVGCHEQGAIYHISPPYRQEDVVIDADTNYDIRVMRFDNEICFSRSGLEKPDAIFDHKGKTLLFNTKVSSAGSKVRCKDEYSVITTKNGVTVLKDGEVIGMIQTVDEIANVYIDDDYSLWVCFSNSTGVLKFLPGEFSAHSDNMMNGHSVSDVAKDMEGGYWFSSVNEGVYYVPDLTIRRISTDNSLSGNVYLFGDDENILLSDFDQRAILFEGENRHELSCASVIANPSLVPKGFFPILKKEGFAHCVDSVKTSVPASPEYLRFTETGDMLILPERNLAVGALSLICFEANSKTHNIESTYRAPSRISSFSSDGDSLILGCIDGLWSFRNGLFRRMFSEFPELQTRINDVRVGVDGILWVATAGKGLFVLKNNQLMMVNKESGLSSNMCNRIRVYADGVMVANDKGLDHVVLDSDKHFNVRNVASEFGLQGRTFSDFAFISRGIVAQTDYGILVLNNTSAKAKSFNPRVYLTSVMAQGSGVFAVSNLVLNHRENELIFRFIAPVYRNSGSLKYRYRLLGVDEAWHYTTYPSAQYPALPPGDFVFEVEAVLPDGTISDVPASYSFRIALPFWRTWWFVLLMLFVVFAAIVLITFLRIRNIKRKSAEREKIQLRIAAMEMKAFRAQMNPHFIFNCINSIQHFILNNDQMEAHKQLTRFSKLVRNVLENSDMEWISIDRELETLKLYIELESMRFSSSFSFEIDVDQSVNRHTDQIPPLAIQPFVENAILHGLIPLKNTAGILRISMKRDGDIIRCVIDDNGIGRQRAREVKSRKQHSRKSMGIDLTIERLNRYLDISKTRIDHCVTIEDKQNEWNQSVGTNVTLLLPVQINKA